MKLLNNASITTKSLTSTLIGVLVLVGTAVLAISSFVAIQRADEEQGVATALMSQARDVWIDLACSQAALYRAIVLKTENVEVARVRGARDDATQASARARTALASLRMEVCRSTHGSFPPRRRRSRAMSMRRRRRPPSWRRTHSMP